MRYQDTAQFVSVVAEKYSNTKILASQATVPVIFLQSTGFLRSENQDAIEADAVCYPDFTNAYIVANANRLEGMYILMPLYGADTEQSWYKITSVSVNRDHLLTNSIDNVECLLKKTVAPVQGVS